MRKINPIANVQVGPQMNETQLDPDDSINVGDLVSTHAHPFVETNTDVSITVYAHFLPPIMIVAEKHYSHVKNDASTGDKENNTTYRCFYYSTLSGSYESNWFKLKEIKRIATGKQDFALFNENKSLQGLKKKLLEKKAILSSVDLELNKKKLWSDDSNPSKLKTNNLLDYLPPLSSVIDVKENLDNQKFNKKTGAIIHKKSRFLVKLRWLNNITQKYSEDYLPLETLRFLDEELTLRDFDIKSQYILPNSLKLENDPVTVVSNQPVMLKQIVWKHYFYVYKFINLFNNQVFELDVKQTPSIIDLSHILNVEEFQKDSFNLFDIENLDQLKGEWFEIQYTDRNEKYTKRIIRLNNIYEELEEEGRKKRFIEANCLLRGGRIRNFKVSRIRGYRKLSEDFSKTFVS